MRRKTDPPFAVRFWSKVDRSPGQGPDGSCWTFIGARTPDQYGWIRFRGRTDRAHRVSWALHFGEPTKLICHRCDNPPCVNPAHLFEGTARENALDKMRKGRHPRIRGERHGRSKLTTHDVHVIRQAALTMSQQAIANAYGLAQSSVSAIVLRKNWAHV